VLKYYRENQTPLCKIIITVYIALLKFLKSP